MGKLDDSIATYKKSINIKHDFWPSVECLSIVYALKEDFDEPINWIDTHIPIASPKMKQNGYLTKGFYQSWIGNFEQSILSFQRAYELGEAFEDDQIKAIASFEQAVIYYDREEFELRQKNFES